MNSDSTPKPKRPVTEPFRFPKLGPIAKKLIQGDAQAQAIALHPDSIVGMLVQMEFIINTNSYGLGQVQTLVFEQLEPMLKEFHGFTTKDGSLKTMVLLDVDRHNNAVTKKD